MGKWLTDQQDSRIEAGRSASHHRDFLRNFGGPRNFVDLLRSWVGGLSGPRIRYPDVGTIKRWAALGIGGRRQAVFLVSAEFDDLALHSRFFPPGSKGAERVEAAGHAGILMS
jgi:hypothetical protein